MSRRPSTVALMDQVLAAIPPGSFRTTREVEQALNATPSSISVRRALDHLARDGVLTKPKVDGRIAWCRP